MAESVLKSTPLIKNKKTDLKKCIICQGLKKINEVKLGSTPEGIRQIKDASRDLDDLDGLTEEILTIKYHRQNCKPSYLLKASRKKTKESTKKKKDDFLPTTPIRNGDDTSPKTRLATKSFSPD